MFEFDYSKLDGRITEKLGCRKNFAKAMGKAESTISAKMNNKVLWDQNDIENATDILEIPKEDIPSYFFTRKVHRYEL